jgi:outer membrane biosynthesis protein TonB
VLASVLLHGGALWLLAGDPPLPAPRNHPLTWVDVEQPVEPPKPIALVTPVVAPKPKATPNPTSEAKKKKVEQQAASEAPTAAPSQPTTGPMVGTRGDMPIAGGVNLTPDFGAVLRMPRAADEEPPHGTTVRNGPGEEPDAVAAKEYEGESLTRKLNGDLAQQFGEAAVAVGNVPGHFIDAQRAIRAALKTTEVDMTPKSKGEVARDIAKALLVNPGVSAQAARNVTDTGLGRAIAAGVGSGQNMEDQRFRESAAQMMGATEALKEKLRAVQLRTVLEMTTTPGGAIAEVTVVEKSGDARFDESVLHLSRKVFRGLPDSDDKRLGTSWWKTRWQFTLEPPDVKVKLLDAHRMPAP